jgi:signal transduction histidine kinase
MLIHSLHVSVVCALTLLATFPLLADEPTHSAAEPLTNVVQIRSLSAAEAARGLPVKLEGVVTAVAGPEKRALIIIDSTGGIYLLGKENSLSKFVRGDHLAVEGVSDPGEFAPIVVANTVRKVGNGVIPPPRVVSYHQLISGAMDAQWVEFSGVVRRRINPEPGSEVWRLLVAVDDGVVAVRGDRPLGTSIQEDAEVQVQAICFYQFNQKRQVLTPVLEVPSGVQVNCLKIAPQHPFDAPIRLADNLLLFTPEVPTGHRVHVHGTVTHAQRGSFVWIRDASGGMRVQVAQDELLRAGDEIDVLGFPIYGSYSPVVEDAIFRKVGTKEPPDPLFLTNAASAFDHEDDLISIEANLTEAQPVVEGVLFTFDSNGTIFKGLLKLRIAQNVLSEWQPGSKMRVAGICSVIHNEAKPLAGVWQPQSFQILIRHPGDLTTLTRPPWWNPQRTIYTLGGLLGILLIAVGANVFLTRRRLHEQARRREMAEAEFAAILTERNRLAREIHDTLAQGLTATSVQLRLAKKHRLTDPDLLVHHLDTAQQFVHDSLQEARNSIWNMRSQVLETTNLPEALNGIFKQMTDGLKLQTEFTQSGRVRRLAPIVENNVLRIGQEAITNATKHAKANRISVSMDFGEKQFSLTVKDDGKGFDHVEASSRSGGFGLVGMRERATELNGTLSVRRIPNAGTEVSLTVPLAVG